MRFRNFSGAVSLLVLASGCVSAPSSGSGSAPQPLKRVDPARLFTGTWLEIGRRPMFITNGCVAGSTSYTRNSDGSVTVVDACHQGARNGRLRSITGKGRISDPGVNAKLHVRYNALISRDYWVVDHSANYNWFIEASPDFNDLWIYTRTVPSRAERDRLVARAKALGYNTDRLEFPVQPPE